MIYISPCRQRALESNKLSAPPTCKPKHHQPGQPDKPQWKSFSWPILYPLQGNRTVTTLLLEEAAQFTALVFPILLVDEGQVGVSYVASSNFRTVKLQTWWSLNPSRCHTKGVRLLLDIFSWKCQKWPHLELSQLFICIIPIGAYINVKWIKGRFELVEMT